MAKKKKELSLEQGKIPKEYHNLWDLPYHSLTPQERAKLVDLFIIQVQQYELGAAKGKVRPPHHMTQRDEIEKEDQERRQVALKAELEKQESLKKEEQDQAQKKHNALQKLVNEWNEKRLVKLTLEEKLLLENYQLKVELSKVKMKELEEQKKALEKKQEEVAVAIEKRVGVILDHYLMDLDKGIAVRNPAITFPYTLDNIPKDLLT